MAGFSNKERLIASMLSSMPLIKSVLKQAYVRLNAAIYRKPYKSKTFDSVQDGIKLIEPEKKGGETFFGYYDKFPENESGWVLFNESDSNPTHRKPDTTPITLFARNLRSGETVKVSETASYNWQQGCRAQWIDNERIVFNTFENGGYVAKVYSLGTRGIESTYPFPVQDSFGSEYFLSVDYRRIMRLRPDYGYRNLPAMTDPEMKDLANDGLRRVDYATGEAKLLLSLEEIVRTGPVRSPADARHKINHLMISPDGSKCIFIHRWYVGKRRFDRLMLYDFKTLSVVADNNMVSHLCWIDNDTLFGYLRHNGANGFYFIDLNSLAFTPCEEADALHSGDGHPSAYKEGMVFDSYPDKSRMQHLWHYHRYNKRLLNVLEVYHSTRYMGQTRCDLHPRISPDGKRIYFDTVFPGARRLAYIDLKQ